MGCILYKVLTLKAPFRKKKDILKPKYNKIILR